MPRKRTVSIVVRVTDETGRRTYYPPVLDKHGRPKAAMAKVAGVDQACPDGIFYLRYQAYDGSRVWEHIGKDAKLAHTAKLKCENRLQGEVLGTVEPVIRKKAPIVESVDPNGKTLEAASQEWIDDTRANCSARTAYVYSKCMEYFSACCTKPSLDQLVRLDVTAFVNHLKDDRDMEERTVHNYAGYLRTFLRFHGMEGVFGRMPGYTKKKVIAYSASEVREMLAAATSEESLLIRLLISTGLRDGEVSHCTYSNIDFDQCTLIVREQSGARKRSRKGSKGDKDRFRIKDGEERIVPLEPSICAELKQRQQERPGQALLFPAVRTGGVDKHLIRRIKQAYHRAGLSCGTCVTEDGRRCDQHPVCSKATMHKARKTFATRLMEDNTPIGTISQLLGHESVEVTMIYLADVNLRSPETRAHISRTFGPLFAPAT